MNRQQVLRGLAAVLAGLSVVQLARADDKAKAPPAGWTEYSPKDKSFTVWLPETQGKKSESQHSTVVNRIQMRFTTASVDAKGGPAFQATIVSFSSPKENKKLTVLQGIEMVRDIWAGTVKGKAAKEDKITQGRIQGREYLIEGAMQTAKLRVYGFTGHIYVAVVVGTKDQVESADATTFLDSFKLPDKLTTPGDTKP